jgi:2'-5' RNA ligase
MLETLRAFVALNLEISAVRRIIALQRSLRSSPEVPTDPIAWVAPTNLHISLRSLGQIDVAMAPALADALRESLRTLPPVRLQLAGPGAFPGPSLARILLVDATEIPESLRDMAERIEQLATSFGLHPDPRPFRPHVVLGRTNTPIDVTRWFASLGRADLPDANATECVLYSGLAESAGAESAGAEYPALARVALAHPQPARSQRPRPSRSPSQRPKPRSKPPAAPARDTSPDIPGPPKVPTDLASAGDPEDTNE